jgi:hypothetical protein
MGLPSAFIYVIIPIAIIMLSVLKGIDHDQRRTKNRANKEEIDAAWSHAARQHLRAVEYMRHTTMPV